MAPHTGTAKKGKMYTSKSSDRRLAGGKRPEAYLHSAVRQAAAPSGATPWNPNHFRLFVGNLGPEASEEVLASAFSSYRSVSKVQVPIDPKTKDNKGFGFVSFAASEDYLRAFKEMNGKYVGQRPVQLKRAEPGKAGSNRKK